MVGCRYVCAGRITHSELVLRFPSCASISDHHVQFWSIDGCKYVYRLQAIHFKPRSLMFCRLTRSPEQIFDDPTKAPSLLADNLPQASNFYLSYFVLQGITVAASEVFQIMPFLMLVVIGKFLDKTPRAKYDRWSALSSISWGDTYPKLTTLAVIGE
jgi:hypothetical protein